MKGYTRSFFAMAYMKHGHPLDLLNRAQDLGFRA